MSIVSDASPIIVLSKIGLFSLLRDRFHKIHIPEAVYDEVVLEGEGLPGSAELKAARDDWVQIHPNPTDARLRPHLSRLGQSTSDAAVIVLAHDLDAELVLADNKHLRNAAEDDGLTVAGVAGILLRAKRAGLIDSVRAYMEQAQRASLYITDALLERTLALAGEREDDDELPSG